jgi:2-polyprenyl-6-methoxyphenol hydroxylase-like FAD-dependent oxidoreductase
MKVAIAGGGIGGLTAALALHRKGIDVTVFEQVANLSALGVGINLLPHAVGVLAGLGVGEAVAAAGIEATEYVFMNRHGQEILSDPRGLAAGYAHPQVSIHRGELQMVLLGAVQRELGPDRVRTGCRLAAFEDLGKCVRAAFVDRAGNPAGAHECDVLVGADGINSAVRAQLYPSEGEPKWNGVTLWRGVTAGAPFLTGASIVKAGFKDQKFIVYPISRTLAGEGRVLINWICNLRRPPGDVPAREDWNRAGRLEDFLPKFEHWKFPFLDVPALIRSAEAVYEFPMVDRDPVDRWSFGRVTLLGDAAHPMTPISSNGAGQAILDAEALAQSLASLPDPVAALQDYEARRLAPAAGIVRLNRQLGPDVILDIVEERAPQGFARLEDVVPREELAAILGRYKRAAGHRQSVRS